MNLDITRILKNWSYEPNQVSARRITGDDGRELIQLRLDLGLLQMETVDRPDGERPHGCRSMLAYYQRQLERHKQRHGSAEKFAMDEKACKLLRAEGVMYYHRYLAEFILADYEAVERDTEHNLHLADFCMAHADEESDRYVLEQYRPYILMMHAKACGQRALQDNRPKAALAVVRKGIEDIEAFFRGFGQDKLISGSGEIAALQALAKEIEHRIPADPLARLRRELDEAIRQERYEEAAALRDRLRRVDDEAADDDQA